MSRTEFLREGEPGRQSWQPGTPLRRGISITDARIGWEETEKLLREIAETLRFGPSLPGEYGALIDRQLRI